MTRPKWALAMAVGFVLLGPGGCGIFPPPDPNDLVLSSIEVTYYNDRTDRWLTADHPDTINPRQLRITVATTFDAVSAVIHHNYEISDRFDLCSEYTGDLISKIRSDSYVYWNGMGISDRQRFRDNPEIMDKHKSEAVHKYYAYLYVAFRPLPDSYSNYAALPGPHDPGYYYFNYDLEENPEDVCFQLRGEKILGGSFKSNTIVIPRDAIVKALTPAR